MLVQSHSMHNLQVSLLDQKIPFHVSGLDKYLLIWLFFVPRYNALVIYTVLLYNIIAYTQLISVFVNQV